MFSYGNICFIVAIDFSRVMLCLYILDIMCARSVKKIFIAIMLLIVIYPRFIGCVYLKIRMHIKSSFIFKPDARVFQVSTFKSEDRE